MKELREEREWTQAMLARKVGVSRVTIGRVEIGHSRPSSALLNRLAKVFKTTTENLTGGGAMQEARYFVEVRPGQFVGIQKVLPDRALALDAANTAVLRLEALAAEIALEIAGMKVLGIGDPETVAIEKVRSALTGKRFKTPYVAVTDLKTQAV